jgi:hypothetical protein
VTIALRVESEDAGLEDAVYRGLIAKGYSVLAPGQPAGTEAGEFRVSDRTEAGARRVRGRFASPYPSGEPLYTVTVNAVPDEPGAIATLLLLDLPRK